MDDESNKPVQITSSGDGNVSASFESIDRVSIYNVFDLADYRVVRQDGLVIHKGTYLDGGQFRISYTGAGKLMEFKCQKVAVQVTSGTQITLGVPMDGEE